MFYATTLERERLKIKFNALLRWGKDISFQDMCPNDTRIFCIALVSFSESSLLSFSCRMVSSPPAGKNNSNK
jgi:hypothetical protein